jgi:GntR family transcriptional repressor for pyruvate dehydrogenase complex
LTHQCSHDSISSVRLHREMMSELVTEIVDGTRAEGEMLPRGVDLAARFDVSRGVTRECIRALEERGLLSVRHGRGATVTARDEWDIFDPDVISALLEGSSAVEVLGDYLECRRILEIECAGLAAERAGADDHDELKRCFGRMETAVRSRDSGAEAAFHDADLAFHQALVDATGNLALGTLTRRIHDALLEARYPLARPTYRKRRALPEHEAILVAVLDGDAEAARVAMAEHLATVERYLDEHARRLARAA